VAIVFMKYTFINGVANPIGIMLLF